MELEDACLTEAALEPHIAVVIPAFRAANTISCVVRQIGPAVKSIYVIDDGCPEASGDRVLREVRDGRLTVVNTGENRGVGAAVKTGYRRALKDRAEIIVKLDADGQMEPAHIPLLVAPIAGGAADYSKGNRFACTSRMPSGSSPNALMSMPMRRRLANRLLTRFHPSSRFYSHIEDPANGYTAISAQALAGLDLDGIADCFFFETDMLFRLSQNKARVEDIPLPARYPATARSSVILRRVAPRFGRLIARRWAESLLARGLFTKRGAVRSKAR